MAGSKAVEIKRFGLTQVYMPPHDIKALGIIVFVHGLFGDPQRTWTGKKETERNNARGSYQPSNASSIGSKAPKNSTQMGRPSVPTNNSEQEREILQDTLPKNSLSHGTETSCSNWADSSEILEPRTREVFWPGAILPSVVPDTRIFTWGYDADVDSFGTSVGHNTIEQHANDLLIDIANLLENLGDLTIPIIFVVHSLGGIVVKEALNISSQSEIERLRGVASATYGACFLGTPHRGSGSATIGKHAYRIARLATKRPNIKLLRSLEKNSDTLKGISNRFRSTQQKWDIKISSFYEDREVRKFFLFHSLIVDNESAQIGLVGEEVSSIPKNHREMTKFTSAEEVGFSRVSLQLRRWVKEIGARNEATVDTTKTQELENCLASLENQQTKARYLNVASSYDGTFQWLFEREVVPFVDWLEEDLEMNAPSRPIFWINGKPGSGKSTLMKFAMRDHRLHERLKVASDSRISDWIILGFFFHDRGSHIQKSIDGMLQEILHQLLSQVTNPWPLVDYIYPIYSDLVKTQRKSNPAWTFDALCLAWAAITGQRQVPLHLCIFLDALDEHDGDNNQLATFIYKLLAGADDKVVKIKICVASRMWNIFGEYFGTCPQLAIHEHTAQDIQSYTKERLSAPLKSMEQDLQSTLSDKLAQLAGQVTTKASGVFIWVRIVVDELVKGVRDGTALSLLEEKVSQMPEELGDLYRHTLEKVEVEYAEEAYIMLQIALCSVSPLPLETFINSTSIIKWGKIHVASEAEMRRQLTSRSGGLLEIISVTSEESTIGIVPSSTGRKASPTSSICAIYSKESETHAVQFIHQTVKDFVSENRSNLGLRLSDSTFICETGYFYLLECAINFGRCEWARDLADSMFEYAFLADGDGVSRASRITQLFKLISSSDQGTADSFGGAELLRRRLPQYSTGLSKSNATAKLLFLAAAADLKGVITHILEHDEPGVQNSGAFPIRVAATGPRLSSSTASRESVIRLLVEFGGWDFIIFEDEPEKLVVSSYTTLAWLLRHPPHKNISKAEAISLASVLLANRANPNAIAYPDPGCPIACSVLHSCLLHYDVEAVKLLLAHEADTSCVDHELIFNLAMMEKIRGESTMSDILKDYNVPLRMGTATEIMSTDEEIPFLGLLALQSGCVAAVGSSYVAEIIGWGHAKASTRPHWGEGAGGWDKFTQRPAIADL